MKICCKFLSAGQKLDVEYCFFTKTSKNIFKLIPTSFDKFLSPEIRRKIHIVQCA